MTLISDGVQAAAQREQALHPKTPSGSTITAWKRRADTIDKAVAKINELETRLAAVEARPRVPFP